MGKIQDLYDEHKNKVHRIKKYLEKHKDWKARFDMDNELLEKKIEKQGGGKDYLDKKEAIKKYAKDNNITQKEAKKVFSMDVDDIIEKMKQKNEKGIVHTKKFNQIQMRSIKRTDKVEKRATKIMNDIANSDTISPQQQAFILNGFRTKHESKMDKKDEKLLEAEIKRKDEKGEN